MMATVEMKTLTFENDKNTYTIVDGGAVHYTPQTLSDVQKTQVLNNIGAAAIGHKHSLADLGAAAELHMHTSLKPCASGIISEENDTVENWGTLHNVVSYYGSANTLIDKPHTYGILLNLTNGQTEVHQLYMSQPNATVFHRGGNTAGWSNKGWVALHDTSNVLYSTTQPTAQFKGQIWLKPV